MQIGARSNLTALDTLRARSELSPGGSRLKGCNGEQRFPAESHPTLCHIGTLQDTASHATYCADDAPFPPGGSDVGTYMALGPEGVRLVFGASCAARPHIAGHLEETGTGDKPLPLRDYTALNATLEELVVFGNVVAKPQGWLVNPELLPPSLSLVARITKARVRPISKTSSWARSSRAGYGPVARPTDLAL
jgi:hypothetical protein